MSFSTLSGIPRRPVIASVASADAEFNRWVQSHGYHELKDANGGLWQLQLRLEQLPHPLDTQKPLHRLYLGLQGSLDARHLVEVEAYDTTEDARLLFLLGSDRIPVAMKSRVLEHPSLEALRGMLAEEISNILKILKKTDLNGMRKRAVAQWIDRKQLFGCRIPSLSADKIHLDV